METQITQNTQTFAIEFAANQCESNRQTNKTK